MTGRDLVIAAADGGPRRRLPDGGRDLLRGAEPPATAAEGTGRPVDRSVAPTCPVDTTKRCPTFARAESTRTGTDVTATPGSSAADGTGVTIADVAVLPRTARRRGVRCLGWRRVLPLRLRHQTARPGSRGCPQLRALRQHHAVGPGAAGQAVHGVLRADRPVGTPTVRGVRDLRHRRRRLSTSARGWADATPRPVRASAADRAWRATARGLQGQR